MLCLPPTPLGCPLVWHMPPSDMIALYGIVGLLPLARPQTVTSAGTRTASAVATLGPSTWPPLTKPVCQMNERTDAGVGWACLSGVAPARGQRLGELVPTCCAAPGEAGLGSPAWKLRGDLASSACLPLSSLQGREETLHLVGRELAGAGKGGPHSASAVPTGGPWSPRGQKV